MDYDVIDRGAWPREEFFSHYLEQVPCTYSMTVTLDVTRLRELRARLYPALIWLLAKGVNAHGEFRLDWLGGELIRWRALEPCYAAFNPETEGFTNLWTPYSPEYGEFLRRYERDAARWGRARAFAPQPDTPPNIFTVSMLPWCSFEGFNLNTKGFDYLKPIFTLGRFYERDSRVLMPLAVQVHHAACDGFHTCRLINELQADIDAFGR